MAGTRLGIGDLVSAGARGVSRYTGTFLSVFVVQAVVAAGCMLAIAVVLAQAFGHLPMFVDLFSSHLRLALPKEACLNPGEMLELEPEIS